MTFKNKMMVGVLTILAFFRYGVFQASAKACLRSGRLKAPEISGLLHCDKIVG